MWAVSSFCGFCVCVYRRRPCGARTPRRVDSSGARLGAARALGRLWCSFTSMAFSHLTTDGSCQTQPFPADSRGCGDPATLRVQPRGRRGPAVRAMPVPRAQLCPRGRGPTAPLNPLPAESSSSSAEPPGPQWDFSVSLYKADPFGRPWGVGAERQAWRGAMLRCRAGREASHQLSCRYACVRIRSVLSNVAARGLTCSPLSAVRDPPHPLTTLTVQLTNAQSMHTAHTCLEAPPRVSCRLVTRGSVPGLSDGRPHSLSPSSESLPSGTTASAEGAPGCKARMP